MGFFDDLPPPPPPPPPEPEYRPPPWSKPEAALAGVVDRELLLAHTEDTAVAVIGLLAYPNGFQFTVAAVLREEDRRQRFIDPMGHHLEWQPDEGPPATFLRVGVRFADGTTVTNLGRRWPPFPHDDEPDGPLLIQQGGGGGGRRYDQEYWVWPLPPPGPLTFVCAWPAREVPESRAELDAGLVLAAARRAVRLWPRD
jgi:hypothetical protein